MSKLPAGRVRTCCQRLAVAQQTRPQPGRADCSRRGGRNLRDGASRPCGAPLPAGPQYPGEADGNCEGRMLRHARYEFLYHLSWRDANGSGSDRLKDRKSAVTAKMAERCVVEYERSHERCGRSRYCSGSALTLLLRSWPVSVLRGVLLLGERDTPGSFVGPVAAPVHEHLVAGVDEPVEQGFGDDWVGEERVPVGGGPVGGQHERAGGSFGDQLVEVVGLRGG